MPARLVRFGLMLPDNKHFSIKYVKNTIDYITNMNNDIAEEFSCLVAQDQVKMFP